MRANRKMRANRNARKPKCAQTEMRANRKMRANSKLSWCWSDLGILEFSKKSEFWSLPGILEAFRYLGTTNLLLNESLSHCKNCEIELETRKGTFGFEVYYSCRWPWHWSDKNRIYFIMFEIVGQDSFCEFILTSTNQRPGFKGQSEGLPCLRW